MFDDKDSHKKARANLILISMAVFLYIFGEGEFGGAGILGGSIKFHNEYALPTAGSLIFYYFVWRYLLSAKDTLKEFRWDIWTLIYTSETYGKIRDKWLKGKAITPANISQFTRHSIFNNHPHNQGTFPPRIHRNILPVGLTFFQTGQQRYSKQNDYPFESNSDGAKTGVISIGDSWRLFGIEIISVFKAMIFKSGFTDVVFPLAIGSTATIVLTYKLVKLYFVGEC